MSDKHSKEDKTKALMEARELLDSQHYAVSYEYPGHLEVIFRGCHFAFGFANGEFGGDFVDQAGDIAGPREAVDFDDMASYEPETLDLERYVKWALIAHGNDWSDPTGEALMASYAKKYPGGPHQHYLGDSSITDIVVRDGTHTLHLPGCSARTEVWAVDLYWEQKTPSTTLYFDTRSTRLIKVEERFNPDCDLAQVEKSWKEQYLKLKKELEGELFDPNGTIWEVAKKQSAEIVELEKDKKYLEAMVAKLEDCAKPVAEDTSEYVEEKLIEPEREEAHVLDNPDLIIRCIKALRDMHTATADTLARGKHLPRGVKHKLADDMVDLSECVGAMAPEHPDSVEYSQDPNMFTWTDSHFGPPRL